jgi:hypothetical protein
VMLISGPRLTTVELVITTGWSVSTLTAGTFGLSFTTLTWYVPPEVMTTGL